MPAGSKMDPPLAKAKPISASVITYLRRKTKELRKSFCNQREEREDVRNSADTKEDKTLETGIPTEVENAVTPLVWAGEVPGKAKNAEPVKIELKAGMKPKGRHWLSPSRMLKYQVALLEQDDAVLKSTAVVNPAVFLSSRQLEEEEPTHDCLQTIEEVYSSRPDLKDSPLENPDWELYSDGSSFVKKKGSRCQGML
ncbi:protein NYNRIN-like [Grus japonensis]|uniref:Protein NYNRIN-like n=1 Tax=Grus japonensis TaxID=30415 RepID=A0ABC9YI74_GRUJA